MTINKTEAFTALLAVALVFAGIVVLFQGAQTVQGAAGELAGTVATTGPMSVTTTASTVLATSSCAARIISTRESAITLTFSDNQGAVPTALFGHVQPASTTVAYDGAVYGCNAVKIYSFTTQNVTLTETR